MIFTFQQGKNKLNISSSKVGNVEAALHPSGVLVRVRHLKTFKPFCLEIYRQAATIIIAAKNSKINHRKIAISSLMIPFEWRKNADLRIET